MGERERWGQKRRERHSRKRERMKERKREKEKRIKKMRGRERIERERKKKKDINIEKGNVTEKKSEGEGGRLLGLGGIVKKEIIMSEIVAA